MIIIISFRNIFFKIYYFAFDCLNNREKSGNILFTYEQKFLYNIFTGTFVRVSKNENMLDRYRKMGIKMEINTIDLVKKAQMGDKKATQDIVSKFTPFIIKTCRRIYIRGYELEDLIQVSKLSVIKAISKYKINKKDAFTTYAVNAVKMNLYRLIKYKVNSISECSLNTVNKRGYEIIETLTSKDNIENKIIEKEERLSLYKGINRLSKKEKEVITWFYFKNRTLEEYARENGICYRAAVERKRRAICNLRFVMT